MKNPNSFGGSGEDGGDSLESRMQRLIFQAECTRPDYTQFCYNGGGRSKSAIEKDRKKVEDHDYRAMNRESHYDPTEIDALVDPSMEAILIYGSNSFIEGSTAFLGSEYDDKLNATDVVMHLKEGKNDITISLDATTATSDSTVKEKFERSSRPHGQTPAWATYVKYCQEDGEFWSETAAPHFVVGMSPAKAIYSMNHIQQDGYGNLQRTADPEMDFKITSEIYEQAISAQYALATKRNKEGLTDEEEKLLRQYLVIGEKTAQRQADLMGLELGKDKDSRKQFSDERVARINKYIKEDDTYCHIMLEANGRKKTHQSNFVKSQPKK